MSDLFFPCSVELPEPPVMAQRLRARLPDIATIAWCSETGSTNTDLLTALRTHKEPASLRVLGAHWQHAARGRAGRRLHNQAGDTLMFSCVFPVRMRLADLPSLAPLAGLLACETLRRHACPNHAASILLKWPNDIQVGAAKLAGILVESVRDRTAGPDAHAVVIGMGMNLRNACALSKRLQRPVADWSQVVHNTPNTPSTSLDALVADIIQAWRDALPVCAREGFAAFQARFHAVDALAGRLVNVIDDGRVVRCGIARGVGSDARLWVDDANGAVAVSVGDVSIRAQQP